jgi:hypothetical protein
MSRETDNEIARLIAEGKTKKEIARILSRSMEPDAYERFLRNHAERSKKEKYNGLNWLLVVMLAAVTFYKLGEILGPMFDHGVHNVLIAAWGLLVPAVNLGILWYVYRYHRLGYLFLFVLAVLSLLRPENQNLMGLVQTVPLVVLSGFLYLKLFPKGGKDF